MTDDILVLSRQRQLAELWGRTSWRSMVYLTLCVALGAIGGLIWAGITPLATYTIGDVLVATISERGQASIVAADATFTLIACAGGLLSGIAGWFVLQTRGWVVIAVPPLAAALAGLMTWRVGLVVGSSGFAERIAAAPVGDVVQIDLQLRALSALLVGPFAAVTPIMLLAAFWPEPPDGHGQAIESPSD